MFPQNPCTFRGNFFTHPRSSIKQAPRIASSNGNHYAFRPNVDAVKSDEDDRPLIKHFLDLCQQELGKQGLRLSDEAWGLMLGHDKQGLTKKWVMEQL